MAGVIGQTSGPEPKDGISNADVHAELIRQGIEVSLKTVDKWRRISGMPSRDPERLSWIKRHRPKQFNKADLLVQVFGTRPKLVKDKEPEQRSELGAISQEEQRYTREDHIHWQAELSKFKAGKAKLDYDIAVGEVLTAVTFMGILRRHIRTARLILMGIPNDVSSHVADRDAQAEIRIATSNICSKVAEQIVFAIEEACDEAGIPVKLDDDSRSYPKSPIDGSTKEDVAT